MTRSSGYIVSASFHKVIVRLTAGMAICVPLTACPGPPPSFFETSPSAPPRCNPGATTVVMPNLSLPAGTPGPSGIRAISWEMSHRCAVASTTMPGARRSLFCAVSQGSTQLSNIFEVSGECGGEPGGGTNPAWFVGAHSETRPGASTPTYSVSLTTMSGNLCIQGLVTFTDGTTARLPWTMWRVTTTNPPILGYTRDSAGAITPVGVTLGPCRGDV